MTRRGIFATLALGLICAIASAPMSPALAFVSNPSPLPVVHSADALRDLWAIRYDTDSPDLMKADLIRRYGPLPWHFERGDRGGSGVADIVITDVQNELLPVGFGSGFLGLQAYGEMKGFGGFKTEPAPPGMALGWTNDATPEVIAHTNGFPRINTVAWDRAINRQTPQEIGAIIALPA